MIHQRCVAMVQTPPLHRSLASAPDCLTSRLHLHEYVDGELDDSTAAQAVRQLIAAHLAHCPRCAGLERHLRAMRLMLRQHASRTAHDERAPDALRARIRDLLAG